MSEIESESTEDVIDEEVVDEAPSPEEAEARSHGWQDLEAWTEAGNDPNKHRSAEAFNEYARNYEEMRQVKRETSELRAQQKQFAKTLAEETQRVREQTLREVEARHDKAVEEGDTAAAKAAMKEAQAITAPTHVQPESNPFEAWRTREENSWYSEKPDLFAYANEMDRFLHMQSGGGDIPDVQSHMDKVAELVKQKYPEEFGRSNPNRDTAPGSNVGRSTQTPRSQTKKSWNDLAEWQKEVGSKFVSQKLMTRQDYVDGLVEAGEL